MARLLPVLAIATAALAALTGCNFKSALPAGAVLKCASDADCIDGKTCNTSSHLCVKQVGSDGIAPSLKTATINPPSGKAGTVITVDVTASEPLFERPVLTVNTGVDFVPLHFVSGDAVTAPAPHFRFTYTVTGHEHEGTATVFANLVDASGNAANAVNVGSAAFDFTPPKIVDGSVSLQLTPDANNPIRVPGTVAAGTTAAVELTVSEIVRDTPAPSLTSAPSVAWSLTKQSGTTFIFAHTFTAGEAADGLLALTFHATDIAGNVGDDPVTLASGVIVDQTPPAPPPTSTPGAVVYTRAPWGTAQNPTPSWHVHADGIDPTAAAAAVFAETGDFLAIGTVTAGSFDLDLPGGDQPRVSLASIDDAGNTSAPALVHDIAFVAALNGKIAGSDAANPHSVEARVSLGEAACLASAGAVELGAADGIAHSDGTARTVTGGATFRRIGPNNDLPLFNLAGAFDPEAHDIVILDGNQQLTWAWSGASYRRLGSAAVPDQRFGEVMTYDFARGRTVMFGGSIGGGGINGDDIWEFDDATGWEKVASVDGSSPGGRQQASFTFDGANGLDLLIGGNGVESPGTTASTWTWDGARWTQVTTTDPEGDGDPLARQDAAMAFHIARNVVVLAGGQGINGNSCEQSVGCNASWVWNGSSWALQAGTEPPPRTGGRMAYDGARQKLVLFGGNVPGVSNPNQYLNDTWEWDGAWVASTASPASSPPPRSQPILTTDPDGGVLLAGGFDDSHTFRDVWLYKGGAWQMLVPETPQPDVGGTPTAMATSPIGGVALLNPNHNDGVEETWIRNNGIWSLLTNSVPPPRDNPSVAFDPVRNKIVLFGGLDFAAVNAFNDVWELDSSGTWTNPFPDNAAATGRPSQRRGSTIVFNDVTNKIEIHGGSDNNDNIVNDAWSYNGTFAQLPANAIPTPARAFAGAASDPNLGVIIYGGNDQSGAPLGDTWLFPKGGTQWTLINPSTSPPVRTGEGAVFASALGGVTLFGGLGAQSLLAQTWVLRNNSWIMLPHSDRDGDGEPDAAAPWGQAAVDRQTGDVVIEVDESIFALQGAEDRPAVVVHVDTHSALAKPGSTTTSLVVEGTAGASGAGPNGVAVVGFGGAGFLPFDTAALTSNSAPASAPAVFSATAFANFLPLIDLANATIDGTATVALTTAAPTGATNTSIAVDGVDVVWSYHEP
jgi:hypothetical protein